MFDRTAKKLAEEKLYILFVLKNANVSLSKNILTHIFLENELLDFFSLQQYLYELNEDGFIQEMQSSSPARFVITEKGEEVLCFFENQLSFSKREQVLIYLDDKKDSLIKEKEIKATYEKTDDENYSVCLSMANEDTNIFCLNITVPSVALARTICQNWDESSAEIYTNVVTSLIPNKKTKLV